MTDSSTQSSSTQSSRVVKALVDEWEQIAEFMQGRTDEEWHRQSILPGWSVQDIVAHMIGTECMLSGQTPPPATRDLKASDHVRNDIAAMNEQWVDSMRELSPSETLDRFRAVTKGRAETLAAMTQEEFDAPSWTPAGQADYKRFMQIRVYDCRLHEQDIRDTLGMPGNGSGPQAEITVDEIALALGFIVGKKAGAASGTALTIELTGEVARTIHVEVDGRASVVDRLESPADVTISIASELFVRLAGGRVEPSAVIDQITWTGDRDLGMRVVSALPFTV
jgi:uncharacterized protein (TIGR03083 family)